MIRTHSESGFVSVTSLRTGSRVIIYTNIKCVTSLQRGSRFKHRVWPLTFVGGNNAYNAANLYYSSVYRVIKSPDPPYPAEMKNVPGKLSIAFSNTTYLNIIWRFLVFQHLPMIHFSGKSKKVHFSPIFPQKWPINCLEISKIKCIQWFPGRTGLNKAK